MAAPVGRSVAGVLALGRAFGRKEDGLESPRGRFRLIQGRRAIKAIEKIAATKGRVYFKPSPAGLLRRAG